MGQVNAHIHGGVRYTSEVVEKARICLRKMAQSLRHKNSPMAEDIQELLDTYEDCFGARVEQCAL